MRTAIADQQTQTILGSMSRSLAQCLAPWLNVRLELVSSHPLSLCLTSAHKLFASQESHISQNRDAWHQVRNSPSLASISMIPATKIDLTPLTLRSPDEHYSGNTHALHKPAMTWVDDHCLKN